MVDVFVGTEGKKFHLHRDVLYDRSKHFKAWLGGDFEEDEKEELDLLEESVAGFELFVTWLYGVTLKSIENEDASFPYFALFVLAGNLRLERLQNEVMDLIIRFYRLNPGLVDPDTLRYVYENTSEGDLLRLFSVRLVAWTIVETGVRELCPDYMGLLWDGGDFAADMTSWLMISSANSKGTDGPCANGNLKDPRIVSNCKFHKHSSTPICSRTSL